MLEKNFNNYLPHKSPFLFVDKIVKFSHYKYILAIKNITITEFYFPGHFPFNPIVPGVIIVESLAQACGLLINISLNIKPSNPNFYLGGINKTKFKKIVYPGDQLYLEILTKSLRKYAWKFDCKAFKNGKIACSSKLICVRNHD